MKVPRSGVIRFYPFDTLENSAVTPFNRTTVVANNVWSRINFFEVSCENFMRNLKVIVLLDN